jgi:hypothetical protein
MCILVIHELLVFDSVKSSIVPTHENCDQKSNDKVTHPFSTKYDNAAYPAIRQPMQVPWPGKNRGASLARKRKEEHTLLMR